MGASGRVEGSIRGASGEAGGREPAGERVQPSRPGSWREFRPVKIFEATRGTFVEERLGWRERLGSPRQFPEPAPRDSSARQPFQKPSPCEAYVRGGAGEV